MAAGFTETDHWAMKTTVYFTFIVELVQTIMMMVDRFEIFVVNFAHVEALDLHLRLWFSVPILIYNRLFAYRLYILSRSWVSPIIVIIGTLCQLAAALANGLISRNLAMHEMPSTKNFVTSFTGDKRLKERNSKYGNFTVNWVSLDSPHFWDSNGTALMSCSGVFVEMRRDQVPKAEISKSEISGFLTWWCVSTAVTDVVIAILMTYHLLKIKTGIQQTDRLLTRIITLTIETGTLTAVLAIIIVFLSFAVRAPWFFNFTDIIGKIYANNLLKIFSDERDNVDEEGGMRPLKYAQSHRPLSSFAKMFKFMQSDTYPIYLKYPHQIHNTYEIFQLDSVKSIFPVFLASTALAAASRFADEFGEPASRDDGQNVILALTYFSAFLAMAAATVQFLSIVEGLFEVIVEGLFEVYINESALWRAERRVTKMIVMGWLWGLYNILATLMTLASLLTLTTSLILYILKHTFLSAARPAIITIGSVFLGMLILDPEEQQEVAQLQQGVERMQQGVEQVQQGMEQVQQGVEQVQQQQPVMRAA
ncbi:hypothetical protein DL96DRAFT_1684192 [Flagelloscypha sp. PMI_526]|nr:hypothetical protein DL96DRAFT_1684192 [Flagelloscypha sp. PMI_526]